MNNNLSGLPDRRTILAGLGGLSLFPLRAFGFAEEKQSLRPLALKPLPLGRIKPTGWLLNQLRIQAGGLGGKLDEFWPDVRDSAWVGGKAEGWERGPYWLDGFLPLAILLDDPALKARAKKWIDHILTTQMADGWLGPLKGNPSKQSRLSQYDVWPRFIVLKALTQWQEATGDERVIPAMTRFFKLLGTTLDEKPLDEWARVRWADLVLSVYWLYDRTGDGWLLDIAAKLHKQGIDWSAQARDFPHRDKVTRERLQQFKDKAAGKWLNDDFGVTHGVNVAMGLKAPGVWARLSKAAADVEAVDNLFTALDRFHGQATGMFTCDEHLAGRSPSQGTELCTVVEAMFSLEVLIAIFGEASLADRLEQIAFNALPATFNPDMTAHQYDQQANQVVCRISKERVYTNNGPDANLFGPEPNFACCLANFHQGWPKFASHLWMQIPDGGLAAVAYAPCVVSTQVNSKPVRIEVKTEYPFRDTVRIVVSSAEKNPFPLDLRIPYWTKDAEVTIAGQTVKAMPGFARFTRDWTGDTEVTLKLPMPVTLREGYHHSVSLRRGPLVYSLRVGAEWKKIRGKEPYPDYEVLPTTPWNYALEIDRAGPAKSVTFTEKPLGDRPFSPKGAPVVATVKGRRLPQWKEEKNAAAPPPESPVKTSEPVEELTLVPYGCSDLRITEFPTVG